MCCVAGPGFVAWAGTSRAPAPEGAIGVQLLEAPAQRRADPRAHRYIVDHVPPGTGIRRQILVVNKSAEDRRIQVYPGAASIEQGQFRFASAGSGNELTSWTKVDEPVLDLAPYEQAVVEVTIDVPAKTPEGERYAVIWAATSSRDPDALAGKSSEPPHGAGGGDRTDPSTRPGGNVDQVHRVGIRIYLDVGMGGEPRTDFAIEGMVPARNDAGVPSVSVGVRNTGGRAIDLGGELELSDGPAGMRTGPHDVARGTTLLPGETGTVSVELPAELPNGPWTATIRLRSGLVEHTATGQLTFPAPGEVGAPATVLSGMLSTPTVIGASLVVGLVLLTGVGLVARRTRAT